ncbi:glycosyltransferase family 2 protein [Streptomyces mesophilus]|uniref:glycosyltransferase family 2 protein n=1 Tax=Streptomyces mesophilus TaxID=1775132 RepID=UPI00332C2AE5
MPRPKLSLIIPYERRPDNLTLALEGLLHQTMDRDDFEVVIGTTKYDEEYLSLTRAAARRLRLVTVMTHEDFEIPRARNMAMRQATGSVIVNMDADTLLPAEMLEHLYERHYASGQSACVVGQVLGYGNNYDGDVPHVEKEPFSVWRERLEEIRGTAEEPRDPRFQVEHVIPWSFAWTGLIALPARLLHQHDLYFDESFRGWGVDDIEWGHRIAATGTPIVLRKDLYALHLPHTRDSAANFATEAITYRQFLRKWPGLDVELAAAFSDVEANTLYPRLQAELRTVLPRGATQLGSVGGTVAGADTLFLGVPFDADLRILDPFVRDALDPAEPAETLPLIGMALPHEDGEMERCHIMPAIAQLSATYRDKVRATARRVGGHVAEAGR